MKNRWILLLGPLVLSCGGPGIEDPPPDVEPDPSDSAPPCTEGGAWFLESSGGGTLGGDDDDGPAEWEDASDLFGSEGSIPLVTADTAGILKLCQGTYYARFDVDADLRIVGEGRDATAISGGHEGSLIVVEGDGISLSVEDLDLTEGRSDRDPWSPNVQWLGSLGGGVVCDGASDISLSGVGFRRMEPGQWNGWPASHGAAVASYQCDVSLSDVVTSSDLSSVCQEPEPDESQTVDCVSRHSTVHAIGGDLSIVDSTFSDGSDGLRRAGGFITKAEGSARVERSTFTGRNIGGISLYGADGGTAGLTSPLSVLIDEVEVEGKVGLTGSGDVLIQRSQFATLDIWEGEDSALAVTATDSTMQCLPGRCDLEVGTSSTSSDGPELSLENVDVYAEGPWYLFAGNCLEALTVRNVAVVTEGLAELHLGRRLDRDCTTRVDIQGLELRGDRTEMIVEGSGSIDDLTLAGGWGELQVDLQGDESLSISGVTFDHEDTTSALQLVTRDQATVSVSEVDLGASDLAAITIRSYDDSTLSIDGLTKTSGGGEFRLQAFPNGASSMTLSGIELVGVTAQMEIGVSDSSASSAFHLLDSRFAQADCGPTPSGSSPFMVKVRHWGDEGEVLLSGVTFEDNTCIADNGALMDLLTIQSRAATTLDGVSFTDNTMSGGGAALAVDLGGSGAGINGSDITFANNTPADHRLDPECSWLTETSFTCE